MGSERFLEHILTQDGLLFHSNDGLCVLLHAPIELHENKKLLYNEDGTPSDRAKAIFGHTPMNRFGDPSELAGAAVYLASEKAASFVTGSDIVVDGGFLSQTI